VRALVAELAAEGATVLLSTHLLAEVEQVCTHVGVMRRGKLVAQEPLAQLRADSAPRARVLTDQPDDAAHVLRTLGLTDVEENAAGASGVLGSIAPDKVVVELVQQGVAVRGYAVESPSLEEVFVGLTGRGFDVSG
jgi:ABC-2 type transport system ATP-binding protein